MISVWSEFSEKFSTLSSEPPFLVSQNLTTVYNSSYHYKLFHGTNIHSDEKRRNNIQNLFFDYQSDDNKTEFQT